MRRGNWKWKNANWFPGFETLYYIISVFVCHAASWITKEENIKNVYLGWKLYIWNMLELYTIVSQTRSCHRMEEILFMSLWFFTFLTYKPLKQVNVYLPLVGTGKVLLWNWAVRNLKQSHYSFFVSWKIVSGLKNTECPGFHSKKIWPFREVRKYLLQSYCF